MANPTTNYGFVLPTSSDLVTDLPADFDVALQGVDTRLKALQPGTTLGDLAYSSATANTNTRLPIGTSGQVLAVSGAGVPAWTTTADVTPLTTKGDLFTFDTADARIGVGANGTVLTADSAEATGLKWAAAGAADNFQLINAGGTALTGATTVTVSGISGKNRLLINIANASSATASAGIALRLNTDTSTNYTYTFIYNTAGSTTGSAQGVGDTSITLGELGNSAANYITANIQIDGTNATGYKPFNFTTNTNGGTTNQSRTCNGFYFGSSAISSVSVVSLSGNLDAGTIYVYGA